MTVFEDKFATKRCTWCQGDQQYIEYHDREWGVPVADDQRLFEKICLEGFQSGLSWLTILKKRERFRERFAGFDAGAVAKFKNRQVESLLRDTGIIRHRGKIEAVIRNAQLLPDLQSEFGSLAAYLWQYEPDSTDSKLEFDPARTTVDSARVLARDLKKRGWKFVGPTTCYSLMQAMGMINDHDPACFRFPECHAARAEFSRPVPG